MALSMVQGALAARILGVEGIGYLGAITAFSSVINRFTSFRMGELVIKYVGYFQENDQQQRAAAVNEYQVANQTLPADRISAVGFGANRPLASNTSAKGRANNRRIDIVITPKSQKL